MININKEGKYILNELKLKYIMIAKKSNYYYREQLKCSPIAKFL